MSISLFWALVGCAVQPASVLLDGEPVVTVTQLSSVSMPHATVLDASGAPIEPQPEVTWTVTPAEVAQVGPDAMTVVPLAEGNAQVIARAGNVESSFTLNVRLPDAVEISGLTPAQTVEAGLSLPVDARVLDGMDVLDSVAVVWSTSNPSVARILDGQLVTREAGEVTITASAGTQAASVDLTVVAAPVAEPESAPIDG
ncbi:MAG: hypothetical protein ABIO70_13180 [Pseudomonadota bacterium]